MKLTISPLEVKIDLKRC